MGQAHKGAAKNLQSGPRHAGAGSRDQTTPVNRPNQQGGPKRHHPCPSDARSAWLLHGI